MSTNHFCSNHGVLPFGCGAALLLLCMASSLLAGAVQASDQAPLRGRIALTFDDAPRADSAMLSGTERSRRLIEGLRESGVEGALFFVITQGLEAHPERAQRLRDYVGAGHFLANHSHSHAWLSRSTVEDYLADIDQARRRLAEFESVLPFYRFPFLDEGRDQMRRDALCAGLAERGLKNGYVTIDNYDWYLDALANRAQAAGKQLDHTALRKLYVEMLIDAVEFYDRIAQRYLSRSPDHVLLLHENDIAALFIGDLVRALRERGWQIISADEAYRDAIAEQIPDTLFNGQGRVAALAHQQGATKSDLVHPLEDEAALDLAFARAVIVIEPATESAASP